MWESKYFNMEAENMFCQLLPCQKQNFLVTQGTYLLIVDHLVVVLCYCWSCWHFSGGCDIVVDDDDGGC